jgi:hypothetical protein
MKNNASNIVRYIILIIFVTFTISCQNKENQKREAGLKLVIENCLGKKLMIPDSLRIYAPFHNYIADSVQLSNARFKIYSHINASCPTCVRDILLWSNLIPDFEKLMVPVILICKSDDDFDLFKYIFETGEIESFSYPFFFDLKRDFYRQNKFMKESLQFETVLTDRDNTILLLGNPIRSKEMKDIYLKEIQKRMEE